MAKQGLLLVVSGPSGCGKGTVCSRLIQNPAFLFSVSATTRQPRPGEIPDVSYHYITKERFLELVEQDGFLEYNRYATGDMYGTLKEETERKLASGCNLILEIDVNGARQIRARFPEAVLIMIAPPSMDELERRLRKRGTETEESIAKRLRRAGEELKEAPGYDYLVVNESGEEGLQKAADAIFAIVSAEYCKPQRKQELLSALNITK